MLKFAPLAAAMMLATAPAFAQTAPAAAAPATAVAAGQTVHDTAGGVVGKIDRIDGQVAVIATGKNNVGLPLTSFAMGPSGPVIAMTRDQLDAAATSAAADAAAKDAAKIVAGASVSDTAGGAVGTIKSVEGGFAVLDTSVVQVKLPLTAFAVKGEGLIVGMTKAQVEAAAAASAPAAAPAK